MKRVTLSHQSNIAVIVTSSRPLPGWLALPYAAWAGVTFLIVALVTLLLVLLLPGLALRRSLARRGARFALWLAGMRVVVRRAQLLPDAAAVVVANHASYLDGIVLFAVLPPSYGFVIKREMDGVPLAGLLLRRLGSHFVDRRGRHHGARDSRPLLKQARAGQALAFFPEGTFHHAAGASTPAPSAWRPMRACRSCRSRSAARAARCRRAGHGRDQDTSKWR
jgi:1-acyl-sn-glycerol-3-phosphate acyltransferase